MLKIVKNPGMSLLTWVLEDLGWIVLLLPVVGGGGGGVVVIVIVVVVVVVVLIIILRIILIIIIIIMNKKREKKERKKKKKKKKKVKNLNISPTNFQKLCKKTNSFFIFGGGGERGIGRLVALEKGGG